MDKISVAEWEAEQQQVTCEHLLQNLAHIVVDSTAPAVIFAGKAAATELDMHVSNVDALHLLRRGLVHAA